MELESKLVTIRGHTRVRYRCPMTLGNCAKAGWMTGAAMWQHLRGFGHVMHHDEATDAIVDARNRAILTPEREE